MSFLDKVKSTAQSIFNLGHDIGEKVSPSAATVAGIAGSVIFGIGAFGAAVAIFAAGTGLLVPIAATLFWTGMTTLTLGLTKSGDERSDNSFAKYKLFRFFDNNSAAPGSNANAPEKESTFKPGASAKSDFKAANDTKPAAPAAKAAASKNDNKPTV